MQFLKDGTYDVRGTVRSTKNMDKIDPLKKAYGDELFSQLELVEADLLNEESLINACEGCTYIVHTAAVFPVGKVKQESDVINPAVNGTKSICKGAAKHGIKRLVMTSSMAAIMSSRDKKATHKTVEDWSYVEGNTAYFKAKTLSERAAWDFQKEMAEESRFELVVINPGFVAGPNIST